MSIRQRKLRNSNNTKNTYDFLFNFNRNYASILYSFRDIWGQLPKVADFYLSHLHLAPCSGWPCRSNFVGIFGVTTVWAVARLRLHDSVFSGFDMISTCDRQTDGWTDGHMMIAYVKNDCVKKILMFMWDRWTTVDVTSKVTSHFALAVNLNCLSVTHVSVICNLDMC